MGVGVLLLAASTVLALVIEALVAAGHDRAPPQPSAKGRAEEGRGRSVWNGRARQGKCEPSVKQQI